MRGLIIAISNKGRLREPALGLLDRTGIKRIDDDRVYLANTTMEGIQVLSVRSTDIPVYVYNGIADLGITGRDVIAETGLEVYELADLGFGACALVVAVKKDSPYTKPTDLPQGSKIATEFPNLTRRYFNDKGVQIEIIMLRGAVEIAPILGLVEGIVDLSSTGRTLEKNGLKPIGEVLSSTARLICNKVSYKTKYDMIERIVDGIRGCL
ncbi:MAG: ATP phosphoribosyltransferase [Candidatus Methanomethyliaceae archaeon]|nr:ATP phosphoribosyltransferase [Candidatus Methanomethyliaceae archaeon]